MIRRIPKLSKNMLAALHIICYLIVVIFYVYFVMLHRYMSKKGVRVFQSLYLISEITYRNIWICYWYVLTVHCSTIGFCRLSVTTVYYICYASNVLLVVLLDMTYFFSCNTDTWLLTNFKFRFCLISFCIVYVPLCVCFSAVSYLDLMNIFIFV